MYLTTMNQLKFGICGERENINIYGGSRVMNKVKLNIKRVTEVIDNDYK